jgi:hypothetical protein
LGTATESVSILGSTTTAGLTLTGATNITLGTSNISGLIAGQLGFTYAPAITWSGTAFSVIGSQSLPAGIYMGFVSVSLGGTFGANNYIYPIGGIILNPAPAAGNDIRFPIISNTGNSGISIASGGYLIRLTATTNCGLGVAAVNSQTLSNYVWSITRIA